MITRIRPAHWAASRLVLLALAAISAAMLVSSLVRSRLSLAGRPVRIRMRMKDADLYSFRFEG